jgi:hypothetical protein
VTRSDLLSKPAKAEKADKDRKAAEKAKEDDE